MDGDGGAPRARWSDAGAYSRFLTVARHGRRIARRDDGSLLLLHEDVAGDGATHLIALTADGPAIERIVPHVGVRLFGPDGEGRLDGRAASDDADLARLAAIAIDPANTLHVAWSARGGVRSSGCAIRAGNWRHRLVDQTRWLPTLNVSDPRGDPAVFGDLAIHPDGSPVVAFLTRGATDRIWVARQRQFRRERQLVAEGRLLMTPVFDIDTGGTLHLAWADLMDGCWYRAWRVDAPDAAGDPTLLPVPPGNLACKPVIAATDRGPLVAIQNRDGRIEWLGTDESGAWRHHRLTYLDERFRANYLYSPQLGVDGHGVPWVFFSDATRRSTFYARWLGSGWSDIFDGLALYYRTAEFDQNLVAADRLVLERRAPAGAADLGVALASETVAAAQELHRVVVPIPTTVPGEYALFLDMLEVAGLEGARTAMDGATKDPDNPVFPVNDDPDAIDRARAFGHGTVLYDGGRFRMWSAGYSTDISVPWWQNSVLSYAESEDGRRWRRVPTGQRAATGRVGEHALRIEVPMPWRPPGEDGPTTREALPGLPNSFAVFKDERDPDPARRYKAAWAAHSLRQLYFARRGDYPMDARYVPAWLFTSPDGIAWRAESAIVESPAGRASTLQFQSLFFDQRERDPAKCWKAAGFTVPVARRRAGGVLYSGDARRWTAHPRNPIFEPLRRGVPIDAAGPRSQIHDVVIFPYRGLILALYQYQYSLEEQHDLELAVSRDGEHFVFVKPGRKVIPKGPPGAWDALYVLPSAPVVRDDRIYLYYCGAGPPPGHPPGAPYGDEDAPGQGGLATLRLDGFVHVELDGGVLGTVTTVPIRVVERRVRLVVNADCAPDATIVVEVADAAGGAPLAGFDAASCEPLAGEAVAHAVRWRGRDTLEVPAGVERVRLRFHLRGTGGGAPRLYGFGFDAAEPVG